MPENRKSYLWLIGWFCVALSWKSASCSDPPPTTPPAGRQLTGNASCYFLYNATRTLAQSITLCGTSGYNVVRIDPTKAPFEDPIYNLVLAMRTISVAGTLWVAVSTPQKTDRYSTMAVSFINHTVFRQQAMDSATIQTRSTMATLATQSQMTACYTCPPNKQCAADQYRHEGRCYWLTNATDAFNDTEVKCAGRDGKLVVPDVAETHLFLTLLQVATNQDPIYVNMFRSGFKPPPSPWVYGDGTIFDVNVYSGFRDAPSDYDDNNNLCISQKKGENYGWNDEQCGSNYKGFCVEHGYTCPTASAFYYRGTCYWPVPSLAGCGDEKVYTATPSDPLFPMGNCLLPALCNGNKFLCCKYLATSLGV